jgi:hypothetical protein
MTDAYMKKNQKLFLKAMREKFANDIDDTATNIFGKRGSGMSYASMQLSTDIANCIANKLGVSPTKIISEREIHKSWIGRYVDINHPTLVPYGSDQ